MLQSGQEGISSLAQRYSGQQKDLNRLMCVRAQRNVATRWMICRLAVFYRGSIDTAESNDLHMYNRIGV
jgi:hypothetical protein